MLEGRGGQHAEGAEQGIRVLQLEGREEGHKVLSEDRSAGF